MADDLVVLHGPGCSIFAFGECDCDPADVADDLVVREWGGDVYLMGNREICAEHNALARAYLALRDWLVMMESDDHTPAYLRTVMRQALAGDAPNGR